MIREKEVERYFRERVKKAGGRAYKWVSPGNVGVPDRIVLFPTGVQLVELKAPNRRLSPKQVRQHKEMSKLGWFVWVIDSKEKVDEFISRFTNKIRS